MHDITRPSVLLAVLVTLLVSCARPVPDQSLDYVYATDSEGYARAVIVDEESTLLHTAQLLPVDSDGQVAGTDVRDQVDRLMANLESLLASAGADKSDLIKLHFYVAHEEAASAVRQRLSDRFPGPEAPAVSFVVSRLPADGAHVALDAVAKTPRAPDERVVYGRVDSLFSEPGDAHLSIMPPGGKIYLSGQTQPGEMATSTRNVMESLHRTLEHYGATPSNIFQIKAFLHPIAEAASVASIIRSFYHPDAVPPLVFVEWFDDSYLSYLSLDPADGPVPIEIELHAYHPSAADTSGPAVTHHTPPWMTAPPTYSRVAQVHRGDLVYVSGLYGNTGLDARGQLEEMFETLGEVLDETGSDFDHLVKATYYVTDRPSSEALNQIRTEYYDPSRPPSSSKMPVRGTERPRAAVTFDMIGVVP